MATAGRVIDVSGTRALWRTAQLGGVVLTVALLAGLWLAPDASLRVLWYAAIPVLPAVFLVQPALWRNVCPLATLNLLPGRLSRGLQLDPRLARGAMIVGFGLLLALVPARRFLFNVDGRLLAIVIAAVALLAVVLGFVFDRKAGFCNSICPVLPVEKLYGQDPLAQVSNVHCATCSVCTSRGCLDLAPRKAALLSLGRQRTSQFWVFSPYGVFAAAFPGFVVAYSVLPNTTIAAAGMVYLKIGLGGAISFLVVLALVTLLRASARITMPLLGAVALALYYWFAAPAIAAEWQLGTGFVHGVRGLAALLLVYWLLQRLPRPQPAAL